jgi:integrating conjugative element protein (TIGR03755 family)
MTTRSPFTRALRTLICTLMSLALLAVQVPVRAQTAVPNTMTRTGGSLYYKVGGSDPAPLAANGNVLRVRLGVGGSIGLNYSCGKFNISAMWQSYMNEIRNFGDTIQDVLTGALMALIASLPMYILQRAQPGLYETLQTYYAKFEVAKDIAIKSCEEMEAQIKAGQDPYQDYVNLAKGEYWKDAVQYGATDSSGNAVAGGDARAVKREVQERPGIKGIEPYPGIKRGGADQPPLRLVRDTAVAGYNTTMTMPLATAPTNIYPMTTRLTRLWNNARDASTWAVDVIGDLEVATCPENNCGTDVESTGKGVVPGYGLQPKYDRAVVDVETRLASIVTTNSPTYTNLQDVAAPGVAITREVVDALRRMPADERTMLMQRLAREVAMAQTIERALAIRDLLQSGASAALYEKVKDDIEMRVAQLNKHIENLRFGERIRKELVSTTAETILEYDRNTAAARATSSGPATPGTPRPLERGRVGP